MPLIESPGVLDGDPHQVKLIKRDPQGSYGSLEHRSVSDVERESFGLEKLTSPLGLGLALLGEIHVGPAGEEISLFQMLSPWRSSTIFVMGSPAREHKMALVASSYCLSHLGIGQRHWVDCLHEPNVSLVSTARLLGIPVDVRDHLRF